MKIRNGPTVGIFFVFLIHQGGHDFYSANWLNIWHRSYPKLMLSERCIIKTFGVCQKGRWVGGLVDESFAFFFTHAKK